MKRSKICLILSCLLWATPLLAQPVQQTVPSLETVVVTASRIQEKTKDLTTNIQVITKEQIAQSSAKNLGDILAEQGVYIRKYPGNLTTVGLRGFRTETHGNDLKGHVLILLNGRRAGTGNVAKILTKNVERIEIIRGPAAVQYGSAAIGGLINVITKQGTGSPQAFAEATLGSFDFREGSIGLSGKAGRFDFSGTFTSRSQDDYDTAHNDHYTNTGFDQQKNFSINLGLNLFPKNRIGLIYTRFDTDKQGSPSYLSQNDADDFSNKSNQSTDFIYRGADQSGRLQWMARYFNGHDQDKWVDPTGSNPTGWDDGVPSKMTTDSQGSQAQCSLNLDQTTLTAGLDWINYRIKATWSPQKTTYNNPAGFLLAKSKFLDEHLVLSGGLRYDYYKVEVKQPAGRNEDEDHLTPSIGLAYLLDNGLKLRANYAQGFVMPAADELAADYEVWGSHYVGNPDLDPEKSHNYELGLDFSKNGLFTALTWFYTDFTNKIEQVTLEDGTISWDNVSDATVTGLEGELNFDLGTLYNWSFELKPYVSATYLIKYKNDDTDARLLYTPNWTVSYGLTYNDPAKGSLANLDCAYTGEQKVTDYESGWPYQDVILNDFTVVNLSLEQRLTPLGKSNSWTLKLAINNLLNKDYALVKGYPMPGRSFYIGLRYNYGR